MALRAESPDSKPPVLGSEFGTTPDTKPEARYDVVGIWWLTWCGAWTLILAWGMIFLYRKRHTPLIRLRSLSLTFAGIILLHLYWVSVMIAYTYGPLAPEIAEYWVMGIWYPFGIALFQASNSQFSHVAKAQSRFAKPMKISEKLDEKREEERKGWFSSLRGMEYPKRMFLFVTMGMGVQVSCHRDGGLTGLLTCWLACRCGNNLPHLAQVPSRVWHPGHRSVRQHAAGDCHEAGSRLGMVGLVLLILTKWY